VRHLLSKEDLSCTDKRLVGCFRPIFTHECHLEQIVRNEPMHDSHPNYSTFKYLYHMGLQNAIEMLLFSLQWTLDNPVLDNPVPAIIRSRVEVTNQPHWNCTG
jgi:hypothetical protein